MGDVIYLSGAAAKPASENDDVLRAIRPVVVYFLSYARNAWHSTRIKRYDPDHFFRDIASVRKVVESRTWEGTVLHLDVLPAIQFEFPRTRFVLTEINTYNPFQYFQKKLSIRLCGNLTLGEFLYEIDRPGVFWKEKQCFDDSVILQEVDADYLDVWSAQLTGNPAKAYCSASLPLRIGNYKRDVEPNFWSWCPVSSLSGSTAPSLAGFRSAVKALILSEEVGL